MSYSVEGLSINLSIMEAKQFKFSLKNITIASNDEYLTVLVARTDKFLRHLRWKALFYRNRDKPQTTKESFGFKTSNTPPCDKALSQFENDIWEIVRKIEFNNNGRNKFQQTLCSKLKEQRLNTNLLIPGDKILRSPAEQLIFDIYIGQRKYYETLFENATSIFGHTIKFFGQRK